MTARRRAATPRSSTGRRSARTRATVRSGGANFLVVTGMSGAGKSHAIRALEDLGYYCVDNLPTALIPVLADLSRHEDADKPKVAVVVDVREGGFIREFPPIWRRLLSTKDLDPILLFLEANDAALYKALTEGWIAGAGIDVFETEPLPTTSPLWDLEQVIVTPHSAGYGAHLDERRLRVVVENVRRFVAGQTLVNVADKAHWY